MADTIKLRRAYKPAKVELEDLEGKTHHYETVALPRSVIKQVGELEREMFRSADEDETLDKMFEIADIRLRATNGSKTKPSTILKKLWETDELTYPDAFSFYSDINQDAIPN